MRTAQVVLDIPTKALDGSYTYLVAPEMDDIQLGCAVLVPFGHRQAVGFVVDIHTYADETAYSHIESHAGVPLQKLKPVERVLSRSYFDENAAACAAFLAKTYIAPLASCVRLFTPPGGVPRMVLSGTYWHLEEPSVGEVDDRWVSLTPKGVTFTPRKGAIKQAAVLKALQAGELRVAELATEYSAITSVLKTLEAKGVITIESRRRMRGCSQTKTKERARTTCENVAFSPTKKPVLTTGQAQALRAIRQANADSSGRVVLVDGVTGSGKTEVYLQAIEEVVQQGQSAIVLVPEISLTPQTVARFRGRFGNMVAVLHSRMSDGERFDQWDFIRSGDARVVIGARSALFAPVHNLGLIVIDEEHETSYKQDQAPRYISRDVARWMIDRVGATLVLGSATPSIEALYASQNNPAWERVELPERANKASMPKIDIVDMAREFGGGSRSMFSKQLADALFDVLSKGQKAVLMLNQRGFASFLLCRNCGFVPTCPSCSTSLTYHEQGMKLECHHCGYTVPVPPACPVCASPYLKRFGAGTQRVESELHALLCDTPFTASPAETKNPLADVRLVRMDADTTTRKGAHQKLLEAFAAPGPAILLGTQMIAKGLDFDDVTLVGVINADTQLRLPDFRAGERTFNLIEQVAGRAGRAKLPGRVIVQTYCAKAAPIKAAAAYDRNSFLRDELPKRKQLGYPPYVRLVDVLLWGKDEQEVRTQAVMLYEALAACIHDRAMGSWQLYPAVPCVLARLRNNFRYHIVIKTPTDADIASVIVPVFRERKTTKTVHVAADIDPVNLL